MEGKNGERGTKNDWSLLRGRLISTQRMKSFFSSQEGGKTDSYRAKKQKGSGTTIGDHVQE